MYELTLPYRRPYDWRALLEFFAARAIRGIEEVSDGAYTRTVRLGRQIGTIRTQKMAGRDALVARVESLPPSTRAEMETRLTRMFDTESDTSAVRRSLARDPFLAPMLRRHPGIRVPGAWEPFEIVARAIVGQQISVAGARTILGRIAERVCAGGRLTFPSAEQLAAAELRGLGMPHRRADTLRQVACAVAEGAVDLGDLGDLAAARRQLAALPGIGPWTVEYVAMRALRDADAFPHGDLVLRRAAGNGRTLSPRELEEQSQAWRPWRAYATILLWKVSNP